MESNHRAAIARTLLGRTGLPASLLGFGAEAIGRRGRSYADAERTLLGVLDLGVTLVDTAAAYGQSEAYIGRALHRQHARGECVIVTKCGWTGDYQPAWSPAEIAATIDQSLRRLQCDCVDVLLLHSCELSMLEAGEIIECIRSAKEQGKARFIGYSGDNDALRFAINCGAFDVIECTFNLLDQANAPAISMAAQRGLGVMLKRPLANAVPGATHKPHSEYAAQYWPRWQEIGLASAGAAAANGEIDWHEAALRFSAFHPGVHSVLIGSSHVAHMADNARCLRAGPLPVSMIERIAEAYRRVESDWPALG